MTYSEEKGFRCFVCGSKTKVVDSRPDGTEDADPTMRRRRKCTECGEKISTVEIEVGEYQKLIRSVKAAAHQVTKMKGFAAAMMKELK